MYTRALIWHSFYTKDNNKHKCYFCYTVFGSEEFVVWKEYHTFAMAVCAVAQRVRASQGSPQSSSHLVTGTHRMWKPWVTIKISLIEWIQRSHELSSSNGIYPIRANKGVANQSLPPTAHSSFLPYQRQRAICVILLLDIRCMRETCGEGEGGSSSSRPEHFQFQIAPSLPVTTAPPTISCCAFCPANRNRQQPTFCSCPGHWRRREVNLSCSILFPWKFAQQEWRLFWTSMEDGVESCKKKGGLIKGAFPSSSMNSSLC